MLVQSFRAMANMPDSSASAIKIEALCSISNAFSTCHPQISKNRLIINYPSELVVLEPKDIDSIKSSLEILITNKSVREKLAKSAKLNAERFDWHRSANELFSVFGEAVSKKDRRLL